MGERAFRYDVNRGDLSLHVTGHNCFGTPVSARVYWDSEYEMRHGIENFMEVFEKTVMELETSDPAYVRP